MTFPSKGAQRFAGILATGSYGVGGLGHARSWRLGMKLIITNEYNELDSGSRVIWGSGIS